MTHTTPFSQYNCIILPTFFSCLVGIVLCCLMTPGKAHASVVDSRTLASDGNVTWSLESTGALTITGTGTLSTTAVPWSSHAATIKSVHMDATVRPTSMALLV